MDLPVLRMSFADRVELARELSENLSRGRAFLNQACDIPVLSECLLVLVHPEDGSELSLSAQVVMSNTSGAMCGVGLALTRLNDEQLARLAAFATQGLPTVESDLQPSAADAVTLEEEPCTARMSDSELRALAHSTAAPEEAALDDDAPEDEERPSQVNRFDDSGGRGTLSASSEAPDLRQSVELQVESRQERLRHLNAAQQMKVARTGELADRIAVERLYGKQVWEALLQNPRLSIPEVTRIARKGTVPKPLLELILENGAWIKADAVRRALLGNPKIGTDAVLKLLRVTPKHELKLIEKGSAYGPSVRESARKLLRQL